MTSTPASTRIRTFHVKRRLRTLLLLVLTACALATSGCINTGVNPVSGGKRVYGYTWQEEKKIGAKSDKQIRAQYGVYDDDQLQQYVTSVGEDVLAESDLRRPETPAKFRNTEFTFRVLDSPITNAFALPGGYVYVTRGIMSRLNNEAQLAVVLGHEITHVAARHASAQAGKQQIGQLALLGAALGTQALGGPGGSVARLGGQAAQLLFLEYSRDNEEEADARGTEYASKAGYDAAEGAAFFRVLQRLQEQRGQALPTWQSTHPDPGNREQRVRQMAQQYSGATRVEREAYLNVIDGMVVGNNPRNGYVEGGTFYHPELAFQFPTPRNFKVQNTPRQVVMVEQNQRAQMVFTFADASSPQQAAQKLAQKYNQSRGVRILDDGSARSNGLPAYYLAAEGQTKQGRKVRILSYFVEYDGQVYVFQGASPAQVFSRYQDTFERTMRGFAPLRDQSRLDVQPVRLTIERVNETRPFERFVQRGGSDIADLSLEDLAIMNQVEVNEQIQAGRALKLLDE